jgi:hypothetical protein
MPEPAETVEPIVIHDNKGAELSATLLDAIDGVSATPDDAYIVPDNARLVGIRLRVENTGTIRYENNIAWGALLLDTEDQQYEAVTHISTEVPLLSSMRLELGDRRAGVIVFLLPKRQTAAAVHLILDYGPDRAVWTFAD